MWNLEHDWYSPKSLLSTPTHYDFPVNYSPSLNLSFNLATFVIVFFFFCLGWSLRSQQEFDGSWSSPEFAHKQDQKNSEQKIQCIIPLFHSFYVFVLFFSCLRNITFEPFWILVVGVVPFFTEIRRVLLRF